VLQAQNNTEDNKTTYRHLQFLVGCHAQTDFGGLMYWKYHLRFPNFRTCVIVEREINWKQAEDAFKFKEHERLNEAMFSLTLCYGLHKSKALRCNASYSGRSGLRPTVLTRYYWSSLVLPYKCRNWCLSSASQGSKNIRNVCKFLRDYTSQHPRRQSSSY
jgi:hypothetical protein